MGAVASAATALALRDIHQPPAPPLWPPAPGWWLLFAALAALAAATWAWRAHRRRRRRRIEALFDNSIARAATPSQSVAAMSELLRRAARRHDPRADRLRGAAWLEALGKRLPPDAAAALDPAHAPGRLLLEGGFRADVTGDDVATLRPLARSAYLSLMAPEQAFRRKARRWKAW